MPTQIALPKFSATMEEGIIATWKIAEGDKVSKGQVVVEIETDKATMEVEATLAGIAGPLLVQEGDTVPVGEGLVSIYADGEAVEPVGAQREKRAEAEFEAETVTSYQSAKAIDASGDPDEYDNEGQGSTIVRASPLAKRTARQSGLDLSKIFGSGPRGRVLVEDVRSTLADRNTAGDLTPGANSLCQDPSMRRAVAKTVSVSRSSIPSFSLHRWFDLSLLEELVERAGDKRTLTDYFLHAMAAVCAQIPQFRQLWNSSDERAEPCPGSSIGLIVGLPSGLQPTVIPELEGKTVEEIAALRREAVAVARSGRSSARFAGAATVSLSSLVRGGADQFDAIIIPGQSAILALGRVIETVRAYRGGIAVRRGCTATLSVDHRVIDGMAGADFLHHLAERVENGFVD